MTKQTKKLLFMAVFGVLVIPLMFAGIASAKYMDDGAVPDGSGGWISGSDGICIVSLDINGNMVTDPTITNARDCLAKLIDVTAVTPNDNQVSNVCVKPASNTAGVRYGAPGSNTCVTINASGYITGSVSMKDADRGAVMCSQLVSGGQLANAVPTTLLNGVVITTATNTLANGTAAKCVPYGWQYRYQDASGTPLPFGAKGVAPAASGTGFCYTRVRTGITPVANCPSNLTGTNLATTNAKLGYDNTSTLCRYAYGTSGVADAALTKIDGTVYAAAGAAVDLRALNQGECLANGASWANGWGIVTTGNTYGTADGWTSGTGVKFNVSKNVLNADEGCLHCHSYGPQANGPAERFKDSYLKTGHKNMLRKVTAGQTWGGPDGATYTAYAAGTINFAAGTAQVGGVDKPLLYLFGDWMAPAPAGLDVVVDMGATGAKYNGTSNYSCASCHTAGWGTNATDNAGLCTPYTSKTTQSACATAGGTWYPAIGVQAIGITDYLGLQPGASFPTVSSFLGAGNWDLEGIQCGRCHNATYPVVSATQIAASQYPTTYVTATGMGNIPAGPAAMTYSTSLCYGCHQSIANAANGISADKDLTSAAIIPVKNNKTAPAYQPEFNSHVIGGSFLNSAHAKYTGAIQPNALGKYDLSSGGTYASAFKGYTCWQSATSNSPAKTYISGGEIHEIKDKATCEANYGAGAWRAETQGGCSSCHDVHQSLFVEGQEGLRKECTSCHQDTVYAGLVPVTPQITHIYHPESALTPVGIANSEGIPAKACEICHMPKATSGGFPMHLWRIKTDPNYRTFPTALEFGIGGTATKKVANTAPDGSYANAVWVDVDYACGQCHGGGPNEANAAYAAAERIVSGAMYYTKNQLAAYAQGVHAGFAPPVNTPPVAAFTVAQNGPAVTVTNTSTDDSIATTKFYLTWGDGSAEPVRTGLSNPTFNHTYASAGVFTITLLATDNAALQSTATNPVTVTISTYTIGGTVTAGPAGSSNVNSVLLTLKKGTTIVANTYTAASGAGPLSYSFTGLAPRTDYSVTAFKTGAVFGTPTISPITVGPDSTSNNFTTVKTKFMITSTVKGSAGANLSGVTITVKNTATNALVAQGITNASGVYATAVILPASPSYTVTATKAGRVFSLNPQYIGFANGEPDGSLTFNSTTP